MTRSARFSGKQITILVVAVCAAVIGAPIGVLAGTGTTVSISSANHKHVAAVSKAGQLSVTVGTKPIKVSLGAKPVTVTTGAKPLDIGGSVAVSGSVAQAIPAHPFYFSSHATTGSNSDIVIASGNEVSNLAVSSIILTADGTHAGSAQAYFVDLISSNPNDSCSNINGDFGDGPQMVADVPVGQTQDLTFPTPLTWNGDAGSTDVQCLAFQALGAANNTLYVDVTGFLNG
jgi:hypothetical protein